MTRLLDVLDCKTFDRIFLYAKEHKKKIHPTPSYRNYIFDDGRDEVLRMIVEDIPKNVNFEGQDILDYMRHLALCFDCTNGFDLYIRNHYRK